ncbi:hypothetical protein WJX72_005674 [[Myrmecia] bisecta]|uniref:Uncharacterized protein n=1 Tax=[Myrmecia] bisecta TaxID=41462 RepID=A0AAW1QAS7_9CHLO
MPIWAAEITFKVDNDPDLLSAWAYLKHTDRHHKPWADQILSKEVNIPQLINIVCRAEQTADGIMHAAVLLAHSLLSLSDPESPSGKGLKANLPPPAQASASSAYRR